jgi:hypothetical protein
MVKHFVVVAHMEMIAILRRPFNLLIYLCASVLATFPFLTGNSSTEVPLYIKGILGAVLVSTFPCLGLSQLLEDRALIVMSIERGTAAVCGLAYMAVQGVVLGILCFPPLLVGGVMGELHLYMCVYSFATLVLSGMGCVTCVYIAALYLSTTDTTRFTEQLGEMFSFVGFVVYMAFLCYICLLVNDLSRQLQIAAGISIGFVLLSGAVLCFTCRRMPRQRPC